MLSSRVARLAGRQEALIERKASLLIEREDATKIVESHPKLMAALSDLQARVNATSIGLYSTLLTSMVREIMEDDQQSVRLRTKVTRNQLGLYVESEKKGRWLDVAEQRGGTINNLVSIGLRLIMLAKSNSRRFLVLDESDSWLPAKRIPLLVSAVGRLCHRLGIQCLYISHREVADLPDVSTRIVIQRGRSSIKAIHEIVHGAAKFGAEGDPLLNGDSHRDMALRYIRLHQLMEHGDTKLELSSGLTVMTGDGDVGKSNFVTALKAFLCCDYGTSLVSEGCLSGFIELGLEGDLSIRYTVTRNKKIAPLVSLHDSTGHILESSDCAEGLPGWAVEALSLSHGQERYSIHLAEQKNPLYVLNPVLTPAQRAAMVDLGDDGMRVANAIALHNENLKEARRTIKRVEPELRTLNLSLSVLSAVATVENCMSASARSSMIAEQRTVQAAKLIDAAELVESANVNCHVGVDTVAGCISRSEVALESARRALKYSSHLAVVSRTLEKGSHYPEVTAVVTKALYAAAASSTGEGNSAASINKLTSLAQLIEAPNLGQQSLLAVQGELAAVEGKLSEELTHHASCPLCGGELQ